MIVIPVSLNVAAVAQIVQTGAGLGATAALDVAGLGVIAASVGDEAAVVIVKSADFDGGRVVVVDSEGNAGAGHAASGEAAGDLVISLVLREQIISGERAAPQVVALVQDVFVVVVVLVAGSGARHVEDGELEFLFFNGNVHSGEQFAVSLDGLEVALQENLGEGAVGVSGGTSVSEAAGDVGEVADLTCSTQIVDLNIVRAILIGAGHLVSPKFV